MSPLSARGGRREGAGRPKTDSRLYAFRAASDLAAFIDSHADKTAFIRRCIERERSRRLPGMVYAATAVREMTLPMFDVKVVAGFPIPLDNDEMAHDVELLRVLCPHPEASYLVRVQGDSMVEAGIASGDIIIVDKSRREVSDQDVAVCELNGEYTVKRFVRRDGRGFLVPANPAYPEIEVKEGDDFSVWGVVTYIIHRPRA